MTIDFLNAQLLVKGETYVITIPELPVAQLSEVSEALHVVTQESQVKFIVLSGQNVTISNLLGKVN